MNAAIFVFMLIGLPTGIIWSCIWLRLLADSPIEIHAWKIIYTFEDYITAPEVLAK